MWLVAEWALQLVEHNPVATIFDGNCDLDWRRCSSSFVTAYLGFTGIVEELNHPSNTTIAGKSHSPLMISTIVSVLFGKIILCEI